MTRPIACLLVPCLLWAAATTQAQTKIYDLHGTQTGGGFGIDVAGAGDVDGDGFADVIVGAYKHDPPGPQFGKAEVFSGANGTSLHAFYGDEIGEQFGWAVGGAGDVNGDGYDDLIVGAYKGPTSTKTGYVRVFSGKDGTILHEKFGDSSFDQFGFSVGGAGDVDADGYMDFIVGVPDDKDFGSCSGSARVFSGFDGSVLFTVFGTKTYDLFGYDVAAAGDVNEDGKADVVVGQPEDGCSPFPVGPGRIKVFLGDAGAFYLEAPGTISGDRFGISVAGAGDVNGDGILDLIAGAKDAVAPTALQSYARVVSGLDAGEVYTFYGDDFDDWFGLSVGGLGDVDLDGHSEVIVGAPLDDKGAIDSGSAWVFSGSTGSVQYVVEGQSFKDQLGWDVAGALDVNGDGTSDFLAAIPSSDTFGVDAGSVRVVSGVPLPLSTDVHLVPLQTGAKQTLSLAMPFEYAGDAYILVGSASGTQPGLDLGPVLLPLNPDLYLTYTYLNPGSPPLSGSVGFLDGSGTAQAKFQVPAGAPTGLVGWTLHHAFGLHQGGVPFFASNAVPLTFVASP